VSTWDLIHGDCREVMREMPRASVDSIVTSPPFADQRNYNGGNEERRTERANRNGRRPGVKNQSRRARSEAPMRFAEDFVETVLPPMYDVLGDDGALMLNLGVVLRDGEESPYADAILAGARELGFKLLHRIVWHKPNGLTPSHAAFMRINHEWVFWLAKSTSAYRGYDTVTRTPHKESTLKRIGQPYKEGGPDERYSKRSSGHKLHPDGARPGTVFTAGVGGTKGVKHSAVMAYKTARHLVALSAPVGATVLDPFAGSGTTGVACRELDRNFIGVEIEEGYLPECRRRIEGAV